MKHCVAVFRVTSKPMYQPMCNHGMLSAQNEFPWHRVYLILYCSPTISMHLLTHPPVAASLFPPPFHLIHRDWTDLVFAFPRLPPLVQRALLPEPENKALQDRHFADSWNGIVDDLRQRDLLTDTEAKYLRYEFVSFSDHPGEAETARAEVLLPRIVAAGKISDAKEQRAVSLVQKEVMESAWGRLLDVLRAMGLVDRRLLTVLDGYAKQKGLGKKAELLMKQKETFVKLQAEVRKCALGWWQGGGSVGAFVCLVPC